MSKALVCDRCGKPTNRIVAKMFLTPVSIEGVGRQSHSEYKAHADIGECCGSVVLGREFIRWQKRLPKPHRNGKVRSNTHAGKK